MAILDLKKLINEKVSQRMKENEEATVTQEVVAELLTRVYPQLTDDVLLQVVAVSKLYLIEQQVARRYLWLLPHLEADTPAKLRAKLELLKREMRA
jgi:hypothetical protein